MERNRYRILLASYTDARTSAEMPYLCKKAGCSTVDVYAPKSSWVRTSRYADTWHEAHTDDPVHYTESLVRLIKSNIYDWVIFIDDQALYAVHDHLSAEDACNLLPLSSMKYKGIVASKAALSLACEAEGIRTPSFAIYDGTYIPTAVSFPLLLKIDRSGGGLGITYCASERNLSDALAALPPHKQRDVVLQEYISGENISVEALFRDGSCIACARSCVTHTTKDEFSISAVREYVRDEVLEVAVKDIGHAFHLNGFCSMTFIRSRDGLYYLIEADMRTHAWFSLSRFCGVDFSEGIRRYLDRTQGALSQSNGTITLRHFTRDIERSIRSGDVQNLIAWICNYDGRWRYIPFHDPILLFLAVWSASTKPFRKILSRFTSS